MLPKEAVEEYQQLYFKLFGKKLNYNEAIERGTKLVNLVYVIEQKKMKNEKKSKSTVHANS